MKTGHELLDDIVLELCRQVLDSRGGNENILQLGLEVGAVFRPVRSCADSQRQGGRRYIVFGCDFEPGDPLVTQPNSLDLCLAS